jgi:hypothetical protein
LNSESTSNVPRCPSNVNTMEVTSTSITARQFAGKVRLYDRTMSEYVGAGFKSFGDSGFILVIYIRGWLKYNVLHGCTRATR